MDNAKEIEIIKKHLQKSNSHLSEKGLEESAQCLYELGLFLVCLKDKQHLKQAKPHSNGGY